MATTITDLIQHLRGELVAADETDLTTDQLRGALKRGLAAMNRDFERAYALQVDQETILPELSGADEELLLLAALPTCCRMEIAKATRRPSFKAGAIEIDNTRAAGAWRDLLSHAHGEYLRLVELGVAQGLQSLKPLLFERGSVIAEESV
ncbi:MAG: hypothetical protein WC326_08150 [Candidatus Delongbacteria bacterium]